MRLHTHPVAVKFLRDKTFPACIRPLKDWGVKITVCQALVVARRNSFVVGLSPEDMACAPALLMYGWAETEDKDDFPRLFLEVGHANTFEDAKRMIERLPRLRKGECEGLVISPAGKMDLEPDLFLIYCNPAQLARMVHAIDHTSEEVTSSFTGKCASCGDGMIRTFKDKRIRVTTPGLGDRMFGATQDDEILLALPADKMDLILEGLKATRKLVEYPIRVYQMFEPQFGKPFKDLERKMKLKEDLT